MVKKAVFIIAQKDFRDEELLDPKAVLDRRGILTSIASATRHKATGKLGTELIPDLALAEIEPRDFDAVIFVGGPGATQYFNNISAHKLVHEFCRLGKIVAAICVAPSILGHAGVLIGKTVTAFPSEEENLRNCGADYTGMSVEIDGHIITAKEPAAGREFGEQLAYLLEA